MKLTSLVVLILAFGVHFGCPQVHLAQAREVRLPQSMKGFELYSWKIRGEWHFSLLVGTNRLKTRDEVTSPQGRLKGLEAVKNKLNQLAKGEEVFWSSGKVRGTILPPEEIITAVKSYCEQRGILLRVPSRDGRQQTNSPVKEDTSAVERTKYVGLRHGASLPNGLKNEGGALISRLNDAKEYGISEVRSGGKRMLWFEYFTHRDQAGTPYSEVKDVLVLPNIPRNQVLVYAFCFSGQKPDSEIVAIADYQPYQRFFTRVHRAWRANRSVERFEEISPRGVKCTNEGYGV